MKRPCITTLHAYPNQYLHTDSVKSTLKLVLPDELLGVYLNPDEMEQAITDCGFLDFSSFGLSVAAEEVLVAFTDSGVLKAVS